VLKRLKKYWSILAGAIVIVGILSAINLSHDFRYCIHHGGQYPTAQDDEHKSSSIFVGNPSAIEIHLVCAGAFTAANGNAITAIATVLLSGVTGGLVWLGIEQSNTARAQLRAYVFVESAAIADGPTPYGPLHAVSGCPRCLINVRNYGNTPAYEVSNISDILVEAPSNINNLSIPDISDYVKASIGPKGGTTAERDLGRALSPFEIDAIMRGDLLLIINGKITYQDVWGKSHYTEFRLGYVGQYPPPRGVILRFLTTGNKAT
jgi:hypothetical protein